MKADATTEAAVKAVLNKVAEGYATRNIETLLACFAPDPDNIMYGTGADEKRTGQTEIKLQAERDWAQSESSVIAHDKISVSAAGSVAWAAAEGAFKVKAGGQTFEMPARITYVLEKRGDQWLIVHSHFSMPAGGQGEGESFVSQ
jgi:ketosteroid isomerase-like protein